MRPRACLSACLLSAALAWLPAASARAQGADPTASAQDQFRQGRDALKRGDHATAYKLFRKSQELLPTLGTVLNLATCEKELGMLASARLHFQQALAQLPDSDTERIGFVKQNLAAIEPRVPRLQIKLAPSAAEGARVMLDDTIVAPASLGTDLRVDPGKHVIVVSASNLPDRRYETTLQEGKTASITVEPGAREGASSPVVSDQPPPPSPPDAPSSTSGKRIAGFVIGGIGIAGLGAGAVTGVMALSKKSQLKKDCPNPMMCTTEGVATASSGKTLSLVSTVSLIAGGVGVGVGVILVITGGSADKPAATVGLLPLPGGAAVQFGASF
jgi:hypothetical protein